MTEHRPRAHAQRDGELPRQFDHSLPSVDRPRGYVRDTETDPRHLKKSSKRKAPTFGGLLLRRVSDCRILAAPRPRQQSDPAACRGRPAAMRRRTTGRCHGGKLMSFYRGMTCENVTIKGDKG